MNDLEDLETVLRRGLREAADEGPAFVAPDLSVPPRPRRWPAVLAVAATAAVVAGGVWSVAQRSAGSDGDASCAFVVRWDGREWTTAGAERTPVPGTVLGRGALLGCDDGNGDVPDERVEVRRVPGVDADRAVVVDGELLVPVGSPLPQELADATRPVRCSVDGTVRLRGRWVGVTSPRQAGSDGDVRPPYVVDFRTSDPRVADGWAEVPLGARGTAAAQPLDPADVRLMLQEGRPAVLTTHCEAGRFVVDSLEPE